MNNFTKRCVAAFASLAMAGTLCAAGAVTVSSVAWASKPGPRQGSQPKGGKTGFDTPSQDAVLKSAPWELTSEEKNATYSLTIFKWKDELDKSGKQKKSTPVPGASFTVKKVTKIGSGTIDLTKYADWVKVANQMDKLNKNTATVTTEAVTGSPKDTDASGVAKFDLGIGLYQVTESNPPKGFSAAESKPFYMTIPRIEKDSDGNVVYNYAPYADPKNKDLSNSVKKTADTSKTVGAGDKISYTISAELDKMKAADADATALTADDFKGYSVVDLAPANAFVYPTDDTSHKVTDTSIAKVVTKVQLGTGEAPVNTDKTLTANTDYTVSVPEEFTDTTDNNTKRDKITISFTNDGKTALAAAANNNAGNVVKVFVTLEFTLADSTTLGNSTVINKGGLIPSHEGKTPDVVTGKDKAEVKFSKFTIQKLSAKDNSKVTGAKFKLFADKTNADNCSKAITSNQNVDTACSAYSTNFGEKEAKGTDAKTDEYSVVRGKKYYVVETVAPAGYIRNPDAVEVEVGDNDAIKNFEFKDVPDDSNGSWLSLLPKTGADGVIIFAVIGMCFVGSGFFVYMRRRKKEEEQAKLRA
ncbi:SpaH/EbpB family LPXTG-anchored major pilin [Gardnerella vaginalis]|uniref:Peptidase n=1 Tax=Gardnerella vaginalis TaxID=2702 RepID=A0A2K1SUL4_GARVA|nr:SpaH/EbpB family LPXTG-anchored major pilin [Gardnerella vaginalis]PNS43240.1 peptidase [Gardnerella vaginalis]